MRAPSFSAVVTVYNAERYIGDALTAILSQTQPPDEVIVVDDGSTDGTREALTHFRGDIRMFRQDNRGHANALNKGMGEARGDYLAKCDADDIWETDKLARQAAAIRAHPEIDIAFSAISVFGELDESRGLHTVGESSAGILDRSRFTRTLYRDNVICPSSTLIRRNLYERLGPFAEHLAGEDYDYWMKALRAEAVFYYDPTVLVRYRTHAQQITSDVIRTRKAMLEVHSLHADLIGDRRFVQLVQRDDLFTIGRQLVEEGRPGEARTLVWVLILGLPTELREQVGRALTGASRAIDKLHGGRDPALP
jgi:glycosyltransferase involved in cell wall biosynthesis